MTQRKPLIIEFPSHWGILDLHHSHKVAAHVILGNQFEPLIDMENGGKIVPLAACSWQISPDFRIFTFKIDINRCFSNGKPLRASHFKRSWELSFRPVGDSSELPEVIAKIEGAENFGQTGGLSGVEALDDETLVVRFAQPFRMALYHLLSIKFSAFFDTGGERLGTGPYVIYDADDAQLQLNANQYYKQLLHSFDDVIVRVADPKSFKAGKIARDTDVFMLAGKSGMSGAGAGDPDLECFSRFEDSHVLLEVNGLTGRFFEDQNLRQALQYVLYDALIGDEFNDLDWMHISPGFKVDPQVFLPLQGGRLDGSEVEALLRNGASYVDLLVEASQARPLLFLYARPFRLGKVIHDFLLKKGISLSATSGGVGYGELYERYINMSEPDMALFTTTIADGDPDGLYQILGRNGSLATKASLRVKTADLLEEGKKLTESRLINSHYREVAKSVLEEVPFVHVGFVNDATIINGARVVLDSNYFRSRLRYSFIGFKNRLSLVD